MANTLQVDIDSFKLHATWDVCASVDEAFDVLVNVRRKLEFIPEMYDVVEVLSMQVRDWAQML